MLRSTVSLLLALALAACATPGPPTQPNDREWTLIAADYQWLQTLRSAQPAPPPNASRKQMIELSLKNHEKITPTYDAFMNRISEYYERTRDARAAKVLAHEKVLIGDEFLNVLSRYDRAIEIYRAALAYDPQSAEALDRIRTAESKRYVSMDAFASVKSGMKEDDVRRLVGLPREDWIKQVIQNNRVYAVWIYPKADAGAAAIYFDNGVVYHTNWNAALPQTAQSQTK